jgi:hypothetical protein
MRDQLRRDAWHYGRALRDHLVNQYREEYGVDVPPPPGLIVDELLTDFLGASLRFDPLPLKVYAQTEWKDGRPVVTVNSLTGKIPAVKNEAGVQNVAKFHEAVHVDRDLPALKAGPHPTLPGFDVAPRIVCYRGAGQRKSPGWERSAQGGADNESLREFWAEEAGRAAAVSYQALLRSDAFQAFLRLGQRGSLGVNRERWKLLYQAAEDIGVNISALVNQLEVEGRMVVHQEGGRQVIYPQPAFLPLVEG